jgi:hypothetical protein
MWGVAPNPIGSLVDIIFFLVLSLFVQRKNQRKGAGNDNFKLFVRPLHAALMALPNSLKFAPFPDCQRAFINYTLFIE